jgi:hypothetical protein
MREVSTRCRLILTGDGETGSPRRRFLALATAEFGGGLAAICEDDATWIGGNGSGDNSFRGVANNLRAGPGERVLFFTGENGLLVTVGASVFVISLGLKGAACVVLVATPLDNFL